MEDIKVCYICKKSDNDDIDYGEWKQLNNITVHYFCLLLSTNLEQNGQDDEGILGFLEQDIKKFTKKLNDYTCFYCAKTSASVYCCAQRCKRKFHVVCGIKNNCLFQFIDRFESFCHLHHRINDNMPEQKTKWSNCFICFEELGTYNPLAFIPSCCNMGWQHIRCMKKNALHAGYYFKCPECGKNDNNKFTDMCRRRGVYIPDRDATWEQSQNAFQSLLVTCNTCDAKQCLYEKGKNFHVKFKKSKWYLHKCCCCGSKGIHTFCGNIQSTGFICDQCKLSQTATNLSQITQDSINNENINSDFQSHQKQLTETSLNKSDLNVNLCEIKAELCCNTNQNENIISLISDSDSDDYLFEKIGKEKKSEKPRKESITVPPVDDCKSKNIERTALVTVREYGKNKYKKHSVIIVNQDQPLNTRFIENNKELRKERLALLFLNREDV